MRDEFALTIESSRYTGWTSLRVERGMDQLAGSFTFALSARFGGLHTVRPIYPGAKASVSIAGETVITGYIDKAEPQYDAERHTLIVSGRDATGDLVDCAAIHPSGHWKDMSLAQIAFDLIVPFKAGLTVIANVGAPFADWAIEAGETVFQNLDRAARFRGVLLYSDGLGNLVIGEASNARAPASLVLGQNIESAAGVSSELQRFSEYIVKAQQSGTNESYGAASAALMAQAVDATVHRYRPTIIMAENESNLAGVQQRADWQRTVRAARAQTVVYTVNGWRANGMLWTPNTNTHVYDPFLGIDGDRFISRVAYTMDQQGVRTELSVLPRAAYNAIALPQPVGIGGMY
jgi:prophage tail gpP-like protein